MLSQNEVRNYETYVEGELEDSGVDFAIDTIYAAGDRVFKFDEDSLRIYSYGVHLQSYLWMLEGNDLVWYNSYVHPNFGDLINVWYDFNIEKLTAHNLNIVLTELDTFNFGSHITYYEHTVDMSFENISSLNE